MKVSLMLGIRKNGQKTSLVLEESLLKRSFFVLRKQINMISEIPVDVISVDGKLYYIPREFFAYGPTEVDGNIAVQDGVTPSVKYTRLDSGVYVPADYVSDSTMKKLEDLNGEYLTFSMMSRLQCEEKCDSFDDFVNVYRKKFITVAEQVRLLVEELRGKGFKFDAKRQGSTVLIEVVGPDGDAGYYMADRFSRDKTEVTSGMHKGKWALLAETYSIPIVSGYWVVRYDYSVKWSITDSDQNDIRECVAELKQDRNTNVFICDSGEMTLFPRPRDSGEMVVVPRPLKDADGIHKYRVIYKKVERGVNIALSFTQIHNVEVKRDVTEIVTRKGLIQFGRITRTCTLTNHTVDEFLVDNILDVDVVSVDNKTLIVPRDECGEMRGAKIADPDVKPSVRYNELNTGLYVPTDYVSQDFISVLQGLDKEDQASMLVNELKKKGFRFSRRGQYKIDVTVVGPDGDEGYFRIDSFTELACYKGKWSLLGPAIYYSRLFNF